MFQKSRRKRALAFGFIVGDSFCVVRCKKFLMGRSSAVLVKDFIPGRVKNSRIIKTC